MCWSIPGKILSINESKAVIDVAGAHKEVSLDLISDVSVGDYVLLHAGYAIGKVEKESAEFTKEFFAQGQREVKRD